MNEAEKIAKSIMEKNGLPAGAIIIKSARRMDIAVPVREFGPLLDYLYNDLGFKIIMTITGLDESDKFAIIYHISHDNRLVINLKAYLSKDQPEIDSVVKYFPPAEMYEREIADLLGIRFHGLPAGRRYPLPEGWPENDHPLRKDWRSSENEKKEADGV